MQWNIGIQINERLASKIEIINFNFTPLLINIKIIYITIFCKIKFSLLDT